MGKPEENLIRKATSNQNTIWKWESEILLKEYELEDIQIPINKNAVNEHIDKQNIETFRKQIEEEREIKSKIEHWISKREDLKLGTRPEAMNRMWRKQCKVTTAIKAVESGSKIQKKHKNTSYKNAQK